MPPDVLGLIIGYLLGSIPTAFIVSRVGRGIDIRTIGSGNMGGANVIEYYLLKEERRDLVNGLVYPVPNPKLPFLGVHFTPRISGDVRILVTSGG